MPVGENEFRILPYLSTQQLLHSDFLPPLPLVLTFILVMVLFHSLHSWPLSDVNVQEVSVQTDYGNHGPTETLHNPCSFVPSSDFRCVNIYNVTGNRNLWNFHNLHDFIRGCRLCYSVYNMNMTFTGPCIVIYSYNKSKQDALFLNFIWLRTLHFSDRFTVHHQES